MRFFKFCKIVPPASWVPRRNGFKDLDLTISNPIKQHIEGAQGKYQCTNLPQPAITFKEFEVLATDSEYLVTFLKIEPFLRHSIGLNFLVGAGHLNNSCCGFVLKLQSIFYVVIIG